jgi:hypothetical protein
MFFMGKTLKQKNDAIFCKALFIFKKIGLISAQKMALLVNICEG